MTGIAAEDWAGSKRDNVAVEMTAAGRDIAAPRDRAASGRYIGAAGCVAATGRDTAAPGDRTDSRRDIGAAGCMAATGQDTTGDRLALG